MLEQYEIHIGEVKHLINRDKRESERVKWERSTDKDSEKKRGAARRQEDKSLSDYICWTTFKLHTKFKNNSHICLCTTVIVYFIQHTQIIIYQMSCLSLKSKILQYSHRALFVKYSETLPSLRKS